MKSVALLVLAGLAVAGCSTQNTASGDNYQAYLRNHGTGTQTAPVEGGYDASGSLGAPEEPVSTGSIGADTLTVLRQTAPGAGVSNFVDDAQAVSAPVPTVPVYGGSVSSAGSVPTGASGPNLAAYALSVDHAPGQSVYTRGGFHLTSTDRACAKFPSSDRAQMAFLEKGGPQADKLNLDPDGDGFACGWDPRPFQLARQ